MWSDSSARYLLKELGRAEGAHLVEVPGHRWLDTLLEKLMTKALVPRDGRADPITRNEQGLLPAQVRYFKELVEAALDPKTAAAAAEVSIRRVRDWLREDKAFQLAHDDMMSGAMEAFKRESQVWADAAQDEAWELLKEMKPVPVTITCRECGTRNTTNVVVRDTMARIRLIELAMKLAGRLKDVRQLKIEGEVTHLTANQKIALMALKMGKKISEQMLEELRNMGLITPELDPDNPERIIDSEAREVPDAESRS